MDADETATIEFISRHGYILRVITFCWNLIARIMSVGGIVGGALILFGPSQSTQASIAFKLLAMLDVPNTIVAYLMIVGGAIGFFRQTVVAGHIVLGVTYGWWGIVIPYSILFLGQQSSLNAVSWAIVLALVHFTAAGGRIAIWWYLKKFPPVGGRHG